jgi:hypothetical protein
MERIDPLWINLGLGLLWAMLASLFGIKTVFDWRRNRVEIGNRDRDGNRQDYLDEQYAGLIARIKGGIDDADHKYAAAVQRCTELELRCAKLDTEKIQLLADNIKLREKHAGPPC